MNAKERREAVWQAISQAETPLAAGALARTLGVSRQVIMGDVALLRAGGAAITATPRGYVLAQPASGLTAQVPCRHSPADMARELYIIVDNGCQVVDVVVEHPVYGQISGRLELASRYDVDRFLERCAQGKPLSILTDGAHVHTLRFPDPETFQRTAEALAQAGFLGE